MLFTAKRRSVTENAPYMLFMAILLFAVGLIAAFAAAWCAFHALLTSDHTLTNWLFATIYLIVGAALWVGAFACLLRTKLMFYQAYKAVQRAAMKALMWRWE